MFGFFGEHFLEINAIVLPEKKQIICDKGSVKSNQWWINVL